MNGCDWGTGAAQQRARSDAAGVGGWWHHGDGRWRAPGEVKEKRSAAHDMQQRWSEWTTRPAGVVVSARASPAPGSAARQGMLLVARLVG